MEVTLSPSLRTRPLTNQPSFEDIATKPEKSSFLITPFTIDQYKSAPINKSTFPSEQPVSAKFNSFKNGC